MPPRRYKANDRHKRGAAGEGPPRWVPTRDSLCPDDLSMELAQELLDDAVEGADPTHPDARAVYVMHEGAFYKGYCEGREPQEGGGGEIEVWHGYPVRRKLVPRQVPSRVLREFVRRGRLSRPEYKKLLGSAR